MHQRAIVLYDGQCAFCRKSVSLLTHLDWLGRLSYQDARQLADLPQVTPPLEPERLLEQMHLLTPDRSKQYAGFRAFRWMAGRLPVFWPLWPFLFLPGAALLGQAIYLWIAKNRYNLFPCQHGQCQLPTLVPATDAEPKA